jgi:hypothetical protein
VEAPPVSEPEPAAEDLAKDPPPDEGPPYKESAPPEEPGLPEEEPTTTAERPTLWQI